MRQFYETTFLCNKLLNCTVFISCCCAVSSEGLIQHKDLVQVMHTSQRLEPTALGRLPVSVFFRKSPSENDSQPQALNNKVSLMCSTIFQHIAYKIFWRVNEEGGNSNWNNRVGVFMAS